ncbi:mitochondrial ribosomal protein L38 isoform X1 [Arctopsyche grandis]|uniref:mitochondrial ribosomal protein L38 isoform X1 n=1 Tax=Arctopsyche grandis TaxID=121162 RepID=UPI00406DA0F2
MWASGLRDVGSATIGVWRVCCRTLRGRPPGEALSLKQKLEMFQKLQPITSPPPTDIGFPKLSKSTQAAMRLADEKKKNNDQELEKLARTHQLLVDINQVEKDWLEINGPHQIKKIAEHYGVFKDLYDEGYFVPRVPLKILFDFKDDILCPVYHGNIVKPTEASKAPYVQFDAEEDTLWTLLLTNLDGHLTEPNKEYIHWCVSNIPGNNLSKGDTIVDYLQPIPPKGTGYHRYVFVLYKQTKKMDFEMIKVAANDPLQNRTFYTRDWYQKYEDDVTPAGLAFFQSDWDVNLTDFYHKNLDMMEPVFEYNFPQLYIRPQEWFPKRKPFNLYMDRYRGSKQIAKEYFLTKLKKEHPFRKPDPPLKFPNLLVNPKNTPSWLRQKIKNDRINKGRILEH